MMFIQVRRPNGKISHSIDSKADLYAPALCGVRPIKGRAWVCDEKSESGAHRCRFCTKHRSMHERMPAITRLMPTDDMILDAVNLLKGEGLSIYGPAADLKAGVMYPSCNDYNAMEDVKKFASWNRAVWLKRDFDD